MPVRSLKPELMIGRDRIFRPASAGERRQRNRRLRRYFAVHMTTSDYRRAAVRSDVPCCTSKRSSYGRGGCSQCEGALMSGRAGDARGAARKNYASDAGLRCDARRVGRTYANAVRIAALVHFIIDLPVESARATRSAALHNWMLRCAIRLCAEKKSNQLF